MVHSGFFVSSRILSAFFTIAERVISDIKKSKTSMVESKIFEDITPERKTKPKKRGG